MLSVAGEAGGVAYPRVQTESCDDIIFIRDELRAFVRSAMDRRGEDVCSVSESRKRVLAAKAAAAAAASASDAGNKEAQALTAAHAPLAEVSGVRSEVERKLFKWIEIIFRQLAPNVEINGIEFMQAFRDPRTTEYEPLDEERRAMAEESQNRAQGAMVRVTHMRREAPQHVGSMVTDSVRILTEITEDAMIVEPEQAAQRAVPSLTIPDREVQQAAVDYDSSLRTLSQAAKDVVPRTKRAQRAQATLDSLKVPPASEMPAVEAMSLRSQTPRANRRQSMAMKYAMTPRTARFGLVKRLEAEAHRAAAPSDSGPPASQ
ncbi:hypothetical protein HK105_204231 [Polyrhizophydium stewartii]|uniref:Uncharacterized protein n=1 Tax=Polyrhizophydium stewartii TaxID=2732419 RepID=A0ABR4N9F1_9FUNG|nr:hypothetical protein HK105_006669 [Polyrhizophydium stewartii]